MVLKTHPKSIDCAIEFLKVFRVPGKDIVKCKISWWNISTRTIPWCMNIKENVRMTVKQFQEWKPYGNV